MSRLSSHKFHVVSCGFSSTGGVFFFEEKQNLGICDFNPSWIQGNVLRGIPFTNPPNFDQTSTNLDQRMVPPHPPVAWYHERQRNATTRASSKNRRGRNVNVDQKVGDETYQPGTLNNQFLMDVWWNKPFPCKDFESSNWNNHKELVVWSSRKECNLK